MNLICSSSHWTQHHTKMQPMAVQSPSGSIGNLNRTRFYSVGVTHLTNIGICCPPPNPPSNGRSRPSITQTNEGSRPRRWKTTKQNKNRPPPLTPSPLQNLWKQISNIRYTKCVRVYVCTLQRTKVKEYQMDCWPSCHTYTYTHTVTRYVCLIGGRKETTTEGVLWTTRRKREGERKRGNLDLRGYMGDDMQHSSSQWYHYCVYIP